MGTQGRKVIPHIKMLPECRNVTKQNCVTLWETDPEGKQVWAGNEACEPVTWQECKLVPKTVKFIVPEINCTDGQEVWFHEPEKVTDVRMTNTFNCEPKTVHKPTQELLHRKKCLLPDEKEAESASDSYGQPQAAPLPSYTRSG